MKKYYLITTNLALMLASGTESWASKFDGLPPEALTVFEEQKTTSQPMTDLELLKDLGISTEDPEKTFFELECESYYSRSSVFDAFRGSKELLATATNLAFENGRNMDMGFELAIKTHPYFDAPSSFIADSESLRTLYYKLAAKRILAGVGRPLKVGQEFYGWRYPLTTDETRKLFAERVKTAQCLLLDKWTAYASRQFKEEARLGLTNASLEEARESFCHIMDKYFSLNDFMRKQASIFADLIYLIVEVDDVQKLLSEGKTSDDEFVQAFAPVLVAYYRYVEPVRIYRGSILGASINTPPAEIDNYISRIVKWMLADGLSLEDAQDKIDFEIQEEARADIQKGYSAFYSNTDTPKWLEENGWRKIKRDSDK